MPPSRIALALAAPALLAIGASGCGALASSPSWVGGGLEVIAPEREAAQDEADEHERAIIAKQPKEVGARHILVMHEQSKSKPASITRTKEQARARVREALAKVRAGASFEELVKEYSDEPGAAERSGDLGLFERAQMVKPFADAAFGLKVNEVSDVVETVYGFHIIKRTE
jgi:peptidyl-prolyl cis-trans isomerase NIMA-interacting 1